MAKSILCIASIALLATTVSCSTAPRVPPPIVEDGILFVTDGLSPKWEELTHKLIPVQINKMAKAQNRISKNARTELIVSESGAKPKYRLVLKFFSQDKEVTGSKSSGSAGGGAYGGAVIVGGSSKTKIKSQYTIEAEANLIDQSGKNVWRWAGYSEDENADDAVKQLGEKIAIDLGKRGFLDLSRYTISPRDENRKSYFPPPQAVP